MTKQERINELATKYFIEQKVDEILIGLGALVAIGGIDHVIALRLLLLDTATDKSVFMAHFMALLIMLLIVVVVWFFGSIVYYALSYWIETNWEKARRKAEKELRRSK